MSLGTLAVLLVLAMLIDTLSYIMKNSPSRVKAHSAFVIGVYPVNCLFHNELNNNNYDSTGCRRCNVLRNFSPQSPSTLRSHNPRRLHGRNVPALVPLRLVLRGRSPTNPESQTRDVESTGVPVLLLALLFLPASNRRDKVRIADFELVRMRITNSTNERSSRQIQI